VALEATFRGLSVCLHQLYDALNELQVTLGDKPPDDESAMADGLETAVLDLMGTLHETRRAAVSARKALRNTPDLDRARRGLTLCQERFHRLEKQFAFDLVSYEKLKELVRLGKERRVWVPWVNTVRQGIERCKRPLEEASKALAACWQELTERLGMLNISVQTIGQKISMPANTRVSGTETVT
jgi:hypothetical protein